jgi:peptide/nickel transport system permease protein
MLEAKEDSQNLPEIRGRLSDGFRIIREDMGALAGAVIVLCFAATSVAVYISRIVGVRITPYDPLQENVGPVLGAPSLAHLFGTDVLGRDVFSRIVFATPGDFTIGIVVIAFSFVVGALIGAYAAFHGGLLDEALMRVTDIFFAIPALVLAMSIGLALGPGITNMTIALMVIWWPPYARLARGEALKISHQN